MKYPEDFNYSHIDRMTLRQKPLEQINAEMTEELHKIRMLLEMIVERFDKD